MKAHRTTALNNCEDGGWGWDRMAIMMISQCYKTQNLALNQQNTLPTQQNYFSGFKSNRR